jgi:hypothetical protein
MNAKWRKLGRLYTPLEKARHPKLLTHAANPLAVAIEGDIHRIFYSGRDVQNRSSVGAVDIDIVRCEVVADHQLPVFEHGPTGSFYAAGVSIGNCYCLGRRRYIGFMAWHAESRSHWWGEIGRLCVEMDLSLSLDPAGPHFALDANDPISLSYPWVMGDEIDGYSMWYGSTESWNGGNGEMVHVIKLATSVDGQTWSRQGLAVPWQLGVAQAFSRPAVAQRPDGGFDMWFSYRGGTGTTYRIGHATSGDGRFWRLCLDDFTIGTSSEGWDSEMVEYPFVFDHAGARYMLYNGNGYGRSGFGLAVLEDV